MYKVLKNRNFACAWGGYTFSAISTTFIPTIVTLIVIDQFSELSLLGWILGSRTAGFIVGAVFSGVITDHFRPKKILLSSALIRLFSLVALIFLLSSGQTILASIMIAVIGCGEGFFRSSYLALIAEVVPQADRMSANAISTLSMRLSLTVSPLLATIIYATINGYFALWIACGALFFPCLLILGIDSSSKKFVTKMSVTRFLKGYKEGLNEAGSHRWFIAGLIALALWLSMSYSIQQIMLPVTSKELYDSNTLIGIALGFYSAGAIAASLIIGNIKIKNIGFIAFVGLSFYGLVPLALAYGESKYLICLAYFLGGIGIEAFNIPWFTAIQREVPENLIGRVTSFDFLVSYGVSPITLAIFPYAINMFGSNYILCLAGLITILASLIALFVPGATVLKDPRKNWSNS